MAACSGRPSLIARSHEQACLAIRRFFGSAAKAMGRILVDRVRDERGCKRGGETNRVDFRQAEAVTTAPPDAVLAFDEPRFFHTFGYQPGPRSD